MGRSIFLGRNHPQICRDLCILNPFSDLFFALKVTISRHFAGYASVALETIWLHEPRDLIFLGPPMTLLCLSRYSKLHHMDARHFVSPPGLLLFRVLHTIFSHLRAHAFARSVTVARSSAVQASSSRRQERRWAIVCGSPPSQSTHWASSR